MLPEAVTEYLATHRQRHVQELCALLRYPSISSQSDRRGDSVACAEHIAGRLRRLGLAAELRPWRSRPVVLGRWNGPAASERTLLIYAHYDVQPPDPLGEWVTPPFEPDVRDGAIYARGASDDKGQLFAHVSAVEAFARTGGALPMRVIFFFEGEEEIGSPGLEDFVASAADDLRADYAVVGDSSFFRAGLPTILYGMRGLAYVELTLTGPARDVHSGTEGGCVVNPLNALARMIAGMQDGDGRVTLSGFYDEVAEVSEAERAAWEALGFDEAGHAAEMGVEALAGGERGRPVLERRWARPTLDCHGIVGGYAGEGAKTVLPARATAKISMRLAPHQRPEKVIESFRAYVEANTPAGVRAEVRVLSEARPVLVPPESPAVGAVKSALAEAFGTEAALVRSGATVPISELIQRVLGIDPIIVGFGLPGDNLHSPNEHLALEQFHRGAVASAAMMHNLSRL